MASFIDKLKQFRRYLDEIKATLDEKCERYRNADAAGQEADNSVLPMVRWHDIADALSAMQRQNPVIQKFRIRIFRVQDAENALAAHYKISQVFLDEKDEVIYCDATRRSIVAKIWEAVKVDEKLERLIGDNGRGDFSL